MALQIELYRAHITTKFKRFEELTDSEKLSVYPLPMSPNLINLCMEVEWDTKDKTGGGSGFKYLLITMENFHNLATNVVTGYDSQLGKITVVRIIGDIFWAVKSYKDVITPEMIPWSSASVNDGPLVRMLVDELVKNALYQQERTNVNYH